MKRAISVALCMVTAFTAPLLADEASPEATPEATSTEIGAAAQEGADSGKTQVWTQIAIAGLFIAVAITALVLVTTHKGGKASSS